MKYDNDPQVLSVEEYIAQREKEAEEKGERKPRIRPNVNYTSFVLNEVEEVNLENTEKVLVKKVEGPSEIKAGEIATYTITTYGGEPTEKDKKNLYWSVYFDGKKSSRIRIQRNGVKEHPDASADIYSRKNKALILYAKRTPNEDKLEIKFSKWLDGKKIKVEAHREATSFDTNCQVQTTITAKPEILSIDWVNAKEKPIKFAGYDQEVFLAIKTLGLLGSKIALDIFDYDKNNEDDKLEWGNNTISITNKKTIVPFPIKKRTDYGLQQKDETKPGLDLYAVVNSSDPLENSKDKYATYLDLNPDEKIITAYFAEERKKEVQKGEEPPKPRPKVEEVAAIKVHTIKRFETLPKIANLYGVQKDTLKTHNELATDKVRHGQALKIPTPEEAQAIETAAPEVTHTVKKGDILYDIAKKYGVSHYKEIKAYNGLTSNYLKVGQVLKIPPKDGAKPPTPVAQQNNTQKEEEKNTKTVVYYQKIDSAGLGSEVHLTAETQNLEGKTVTFKVFEKEPTLLDQKDTPVPLLVNNEEQTEIEATVSDGKAQVKVTLKRRDDCDQDDWKEKLSPQEKELDNMYLDTEKQQSVFMQPFDLRLATNPDRYTPAVETIPAQKTQLWLQVTCQGDQLDFDQKFFNKNRLEVDYSDRAPWMKIALKLAKEAGGCEESKEPMYSMAKGYLRFVGNSHDPTDGIKGPWCAAFMNWCISESGYKYAKSASSLATLHELYKGNFKKTEKPIYGCIVVYKHTKKWKGHTGFLYGMTKDDKYLMLGGNQDQTIKLDDYGEYTSKSKTKKLYGFYVPIDYEISNSDYLTNGDKNLDLEKENKKIGVKSSKSSGQTN